MDLARNIRFNSYDSGDQNHAPGGMSRPRPPPPPPPPAFHFIRGPHPQYLPSNQSPLPVVGFGPRYGGNEYGQRSPVIGRVFCRPQNLRQADPNENGPNNIRRTYARQDHGNHDYDYPHQGNSRLRHQAPPQLPPRTMRMDANGNFWVPAPPGTVYRAPMSPMGNPFRPRPPQWSPRIMLDSHGNVCQNDYPRTLHGAYTPSIPMMNTPSRPRLPQYIIGAGSGYGRNSNPRHSKGYLAWTCRLADGSFLEKPSYGCRFCLMSGESGAVWMNHVLKVNGKVTCPVLRSFKCPICKAEGDHAHTIKYCPQNRGNKRPVIARARNSVGRPTSVSMSKAGSLVPEPEPSTTQKEHHIEAQVSTPGANEPNEESRVTEPEPSTTQKEHHIEGQVSAPGANEPNEESHVTQPKPSTTQKEHHIEGQVSSTPGGNEPNEESHVTEPERLAEVSEEEANKKENEVDPYDPSAEAFDA